MKHSRGLAGLVAVAALSGCAILTGSAGAGPQPPTGPLPTLDLPPTGHACDKLPHAAYVAAGGSDVVLAESRNPASFSKHGPGFAAVCTFSALAGQRTGAVGYTSLDPADVSAATALDELLGPETLATDVAGLPARYTVRTLTPGIELDLVVSTPPLLLYVTLTDHNPATGVTPLLSLARQLAAATLTPSTPTPPPLGRRGPLPTLVLPAGGHSCDKLPSAAYAAAAGGDVTLTESRNPASYSRQGPGFSGVCTFSARTGRRSGGVAYTSLAPTDVSPATALTELLGSGSQVTYVSGIPSRYAVRPFAQGNEVRLVVPIPPLLLYVNLTDRSPAADPTPLLVLARQLAAATLTRATAPPTTPGPTGPR